jgi:HTH-type transcriptional regulator/antitoxin HigA
MNAQLKRLADHFAAVQRDVPLRPIRNQRDYDAAVTAMNRLLDAGAANERHPLANLVAILGELIGDYDDRHYRLPDIAGIDVLKFLMDQHGLKQGDLPEIGSQGVVSELIRGKREINLRQIRMLRQRFGVSADAFT